MVVVVVVGVPVVYSFMTTNDPKAFTKGFVTYDRHEHKLRHSKVGTRPPVLDTKDDVGLMNGFAVWLTTTDGFGKAAWP